MTWESGTLWLDLVGIAACRRVAQRIPNSERAARWDISSFRSQMTSSEESYEASTEVGGRSCRWWWLRGWALPVDKPDLKLSKSFPDRWVASSVHVGHCDGHPKHGGANKDLTMAASHTQTICSTVHEKAGSAIFAGVALPQQQALQFWCSPWFASNLLIPPRIRVTLQCHPAHHQHHGRISRFCWRFPNKHFDLIQWHPGVPLASTTI